MDTPNAQRVAHVMIDLETLGKGDDAMVWSIGAVKFDPLDAHHRVLDKFYVVIDLRSSEQYGRKPDIDTILWWMHPDRARARKQLLESDRKVDFVSALEGLSEWLKVVNPDPNDPRVIRLPVWSMGALFDINILNHCYASIGQETPWSYKEESCVRSIRRLLPGFKATEVGTAHNALDDAIHQAYWMKDIIAKLGITNIE